MQDEEGDVTNMLHNAQNNTFVWWYDSNTKEIMGQLDIHNLKPRHFEDKCHKESS